MNEQTSSESRFWQVNLGHLITIGTILVALGGMYSRVSETMESQGAAIITLGDRTSKLESNQTQMAIADAAQAKDVSDMHHDIEEDLSRRVSKLEDEIERERDRKVTP